jgi:hypothetical protein
MTPKDELDWPEGGDALRYLGMWLQYQGLRILHGEGSPLLEGLQTEMGMLYWEIRGPEKKRLQKILQRHPFCPRTLAWEPYGGTSPQELLLLAKVNFYPAVGPIRYVKWNGATYNVRLEDDTLKGMVWKWVGEHDWEP